MSPKRDYEALRETNPSGYYRLRALLMAFLVLCLLAVGAALTGLYYIALKASEQSDINGTLLEEIESTNDRLIDCTTPEGECYQQGQDQTAQAIVGINEGTLKVIVAALTCQEDGVEGEKALARCTVRLSAD